MQFLSFIDIEMGIKRGIYRLLNNGQGKTLVWDAEKRAYVGHVDLPSVEKEATAEGIDLAKWIGYGTGDDWGSSGW